MRKKIFLLVITIFIFLINSSHAILEVKKLPYEDAVIEKIYKLKSELCNKILIALPPINAPI